MISHNFKPDKYHVVVLSGGKSAEREVSLASGLGAKKALEEAGFKVSVLDPAYKENLKKLIDTSYDVAFICLHGKYGEDGAIQGFLEVVGIPYIGSGIWASALSLNKQKTKEFYLKEDLLTPPYRVINLHESIDQAEILTVLGDQLVVKPLSEGSSLDVYIVEGKKELADAIHEIRKTTSFCMVEKYVKGVELTVLVLGTEKPQALPIIKVIPKGDFYNYEAKYTPGGSQHICPAPLSTELTQEVQGLACKAHKTLGCSGVSRSDFILDESNCCWILETNTIPGMTETSLLPDAARVAGISFSDLATQLVKKALTL